MNSKREKEQDEHRETVVTGQVEKRSASTAHYTSVLPGDRESPIPLPISTDHYTGNVIGRPQEIKKGRGNQARDISDDNNTIQSSGKTRDEESKQ